MSDVHTAAMQGFSSAAQAYQRGRPEYPQALAGWLRDRLGLGAGHAVIDLGAGTGKFTGLLVETGARTFAVEPVDAMRAELVARLPSVEAIAGSAQAIPLPDASVDVVVCAQAFHWFAHRESLMEIHRVLKPQGRLGLIWNVRDESVDWVAEITAIMTPFEGDAPRFYKGDWRRPFDTAPFSALEECRFNHAHVGAPQDVIVNRFLSVSFIAALPSSEKVRVAARLESLVETHPGLRGRPEIAFPYQTLAFSCVRL